MEKHLRIRVDDGAREPERKDIDRLPHGQIPGSWGTRGHFWKESRAPVSTSLGAGVLGRASVLGPGPCLLVLLGPHLLCQQKLSEWEGQGPLFWFFYTSLDLKSKIILKS